MDTTNVLRLWLCIFVVLFLFTVAVMIVEFSTSSTVDTSEQVVTTCPEGCIAYKDVFNVEELSTALFLIVFFLVMMLFLTGVAVSL